MDKWILYRLIYYGGRICVSILIYVHVEDGDEVRGRRQKFRFNNLFMVAVLPVFRSYFFSTKSFLNTFMQPEVTKLTDINL